MSEIHKNIKKIRLKKGLSQRLVAKDIGISASALSKIESGETDINISRLFQIAEMFKVSLFEIVSNVVENQQALSHLEKVKSLQLKVSENKRDIEIMQKKAIILYEEIFLNLERI